MMENKYLDESNAVPSDETSSPIFGYQDEQIMPLEKAVESITNVMPNVINYVRQAQLNCTKSSTLTEDESAAIYLYTMGSPFFSTLNGHLRAMNREALRAWFGYLKLFITALNNLPSFKGTVWRGVSKIIDFSYADYSTQTWWAITSTSRAMDTIKCFLGETGTLYTIDGIYGKDVSQYAAIPTEQEVILMPGTRIYLTSEPLVLSNGSLMLSFKECTNIPQGKHVMFSHDISDDIMVSQILQIFLRDESIPVGFNKDRSWSDNIYDSLAVGVENAAFVCCFISPEYERSARCQIELQYATKCHKKIIPCLIRAQENWEPVGWLKAILQGVKYIDFRHLSKPSIQSKANPLFCKLQDLEYAPQDVSKRSNILFELIKYEYIRKSRIERFINPSISYPIEKSYINLAIVETKEQQEKEKKLRDPQPSSAIMDVFEAIHGNKTLIDVKDIFKTCKDRTRKVLVFGRAGIGKSTFCRYVAYQWATGAIWSEYELVVLIPLRSLTEQDCQAGIPYYLVDVLKKQYFSNFPLSIEEEKRLGEQIRTSRILWLLDGYDEIVQNGSTHLRRLVDQLLDTPDHIVTSRPYMNTLSYSVQLEITGFTDDNIPKYIEQFFKQLEDTSQDSSLQEKELLELLKQNPRIWGIAHIPINLELICSVWSDTNWLETKTLTMTRLYDKIIEWLCRRYLKRKDKTMQMTKEDIFKECYRELAFLEILAFKGMENSTIILRPQLLKQAFTEANYSSKDFVNSLDIGILKSLKDDKRTSSQIEVDKNHYFVHLSFQEYFAARYLVKTLNGDTNQKKKAIDFIKSHKYNQRYELIFTFASGLLNENNELQCLETFWDSILGKPLDLIGFRHTQLIISCIEETSDNSSIPPREDIMQSISKWITIVATTNHKALVKPLGDSFRRNVSLANSVIIQNVLTRLLDHEDPETKETVLTLISTLLPSNSQSPLIHELYKALEDDNRNVKARAYEALGNIHEEAVTNDVLDRLTTALGYRDFTVSGRACDALVKIGKKAAGDDVIKALLVALKDRNNYVRFSASRALRKIGEKAARDDVINALVAALVAMDIFVQDDACRALGKFGEKAARDDVINALAAEAGKGTTNGRDFAVEALGKIGGKVARNDVINALIAVMGASDYNSRECAAEALGKIGEKAARDDVINALLVALGDAHDDIKSNACEALGGIGKIAVRTDVIRALVTTLENSSYDVKESAAEALGNIGEIEARDDIINALVAALGNRDDDVRKSACRALAQIGEKAARDDVIKALVAALGNGDDDVRESACGALGKIGKKAENNDAFNGLMTALGDGYFRVRARACRALGQIDEKAVRNDVIQALVTALADADYWVKQSACDGLGEIGEKVASDDVLDGLMTALGDTCDHVRWSACEALRQIGEKAARDDVIKALVAALEDGDGGVRSSAVQALWCIGEKAARDDVIKALVTALGDPYDHVRSNACVALGRIGEKAARDDVLTALVAVLADANDHVAECACRALWWIGEKAARGDVINGLVTALRDANRRVMPSACEALVKIGEKAATNDVINGLLNTLDMYDKDEAYSIVHALEQLLSLITVHKSLQSDTVSKLSRHVERLSNFTCERVHLDQFIEAFIRTKDSVWLRLINIVALRQGSAVTIAENSIIVYGGEEPAEIHVSSSELLLELESAFTDQMQRLNFYVN